MTIEPVQKDPVHVITVPYSSDNYGFLLVHRPTNQAIAIDTGESTPFIHLISHQQLHLMAILCTHHHADHVGAVTELVTQYPSVRVYAHRLDSARIPAVTHIVDNDTPLHLAPMHVFPLHTQGHTNGSTCWLIDDCLFTGDTLFVAGCGRLFESTAENMCHSLYDIIGRLPGDTRVYCGHDYALSNLRFAKAVEPSNPEIHAHLARFQSQARHHCQSAASKLADERAYNPFLRCNEPEVIAFARNYLRSAAPNETTPLTRCDVFAAIRSAKDRFTG